MAFGYHIPEWQTLAGWGSRKLMPVRRRRFLGQGLMLILAGLGRRAWTQGLAFRFRPLARPVVVLREDLVTPWRARQFVADGVTLSSAATPNQPDRLTAVCLRCPHEGCDVDFIADLTRLPQEVKDDIGHAVKNPVYICPCHNSTFKAEDGERLAGPAPLAESLEPCRHKFALRNR